MSAKSQIKNDSTLQVGKNVEKRDSYKGGNLLKLEQK